MSEIAIEAIAQLHLEPGDALLIQVPGPITPKDEQRIKEKIKAGLGESFHGVPLLVLDHHINIERIKREDLHDTMRAITASTEEPLRTQGLSQMRSDLQQKRDARRESLLQRTERRK